MVRHTLITSCPDGDSTTMPTRPSLADLQMFLNTAKQLAAGADELLLQGFGKVTASRKADGTLVTQTDHAVDRYLTQELTTRYPDHAVLSEERTTHYDPTAEFSWVIDPLDGTTNFARGLPIWGVSIALLYLGLPVVGLLSFVSLHEQYTALLGAGASFNDLPLHTAAETRADDQHFLMLCTRTPRRYHVDTLLKPRILGSAAYHLVAVANGSALAGIEATPKIWDIAAALLILTEAGGCYRCLDDRNAIFPLPSAAQDYERTSFPLLTAANLPILQELEATLVKHY
jgi:myo-inositol-1(or 4)-monophosphatase